MYTSTLPHAFLTSKLVKLGQRQGSDTVYAATTRLEVF